MNIRLRAIAKKDVEEVLKWSSDIAFCQANGWQVDRHPEEIRRWWTNVLNHPPKNFIRLGIVFEEVLVGYTDLAAISDHSAELGIAIGNSKLWGSGIGTHAAVKMMKYGVEELNLTSFYAETHEANLRSRRMLGKLNFKEISREGFEDYKGERCRLIQFHLKISC